eukprot:m51a1_g2860 hypothetical protein (284) ;mRNA; f:337989-339069
MDWVLLACALVLYVMYVRHRRAAGLSSPEGRAPAPEAPAPEPPKRGRHRPRAAPVRLPRMPANPSESDAKWAREAHAWLVDVYRLRVEQDLRAGIVHGARIEESTMHGRALVDFALFCGLVDRKGLTPDDWDWSLTLAVAGLLAARPVTEEQVAAKYGAPVDAESLRPSSLHGYPSPEDTAAFLYGCAAGDNAIETEFVRRLHTDVAKAFNELANSGGTFRGAASRRFCGRIGGTSVWTSFANFMAQSDDRRAVQGDERFEAVQNELRQRLAVDIGISTAMLV